MYPRINSNASPNNNQLITYYKPVSCLSLETSLETASTGSLHINPSEN